MLQEYQKKELKKLYLVLLSTVTILVEIICVITANPTALLADVIHMGSILLEIDPCKKAQN